MVMDFEKTLHALVAQEKAKEYSMKPIRTLGEVILLLEAQPASNTVKIDFIEQNPSGLDSYRGYYTDLSLEYDLDAEPMTVRELLKMFKEADGKTYGGYKGGDFIMHRKTLVWVAPYGSCGRMFTDVKSRNKVTTIITQEDE